ncbi:MAG: DUF4296 domain-containing protein [Bacteroidaceae bacterium]|nr:DUF4296 domain-containing protein [Bacteroidaceae bacterium]
MRRLLRVIFPLFFFVLISCEVGIPDNIVPPKKMESFLYDYHLVQSMASEYSSWDYKEKLFYDYIFKKHNITQERFDSSLIWYNRYPKRLKRIYENLEVRLEAEVASLNDARASFDDGVLLEAAFLAADTAQLWTSSKMRLLASTHVNSKLFFAFDVPDDTTFVKGDSLTFSFGSYFINGGNDKVNQEAFASIRIDYDNGAYYHKNLRITESGEYSLATPRDFNRNLKSMSGFVYYIDDDEKAKAKMLLSGISVTRIHPPKSQKQK